MTPSEPPAAATEAANVERLMREAIELNRSGHTDASLRAWDRVLKLDPEHPDALYHLGHQLLANGKTSDAESFFKRALKRADGAPLVHFALAQTAHKLDKADEELAALDRVLTLDPYSVSALLAKGAACERLGKLRTAGAVYSNALKAVSTSADIPPQIRPALARAARVVNEHQISLDAYLTGAVSEIRNRAAPGEAARYDECQAVFSGLKTAYVQRPLLLHYPQLPAIQFYDRKLFPWIESFEAHTAAVRAELTARMQAEALAWVPYIDHPDGSPLNQWSDLQRSSQWNSLFLWKDGYRNDEVNAKFPATASALEEVPLNVSPGRGPTVFFSALAPNTRIPPHTGSTNARLVLHLPLIVPGDCGLRVGNETREFVEGKAWVFDDTIEHEAWNNSDLERIVLLVDIWNPLLTKTERELVAALMSANARFYAEES